MEPRRFLEPDLAADTRAHANRRMHRAIGREYSQCITPDIAEHRTFQVAQRLEHLNMSAPLA